MGISRLTFLRSAACLLALQLSLPLMAVEVDEVTCGTLKNADTGPWDYRLATPDEKALVEDWHFPAELEHQLKGIKTKFPGDDLDYTLRAFPNHPRALLTMVKLGEKERTERPRGAKYSIECYFERAIRFRNDDAGVRLVYGMYLNKKRRPKEAIEQLQFAERLNNGDMNVQYNLGLAYFEAGDFGKSLSHAHVAYGLGFPLPGLKNKLQRAGKWAEPAPSKSEASGNLQVPAVPPASKQ